MIFISHRGNLDGLNPDRENSPDYIDEAIKLGFDVEIDVRTKDGELWLGHDEPQYKVSEMWLLERQVNLWLHAKDYESLGFLNTTSLEHFWHERDRFTITSHGYIWSHDFSEKMNCRCVIPLLSLEEVENYKQRNFYAVCSDFVFACKEKFR